MDNVVRLRSAPQVEVWPIMPDYLHDALGDAVRLLEPAVKRQSQNVDMEHIVEDLTAGQSLLWMVHVDGEAIAAIVTCVVSNPKRHNLKIEWMGGDDMHLWGDHALAILTKAAKTAKLDAIEADGRRGFLKHIEAASFREMYTHYEMELN